MKWLQRWSERRAERRCIDRLTAEVRERVLRVAGGESYREVYRTR